MRSNKASARYCSGVGAIPDTHIDWEKNSLRATLKRRTYTNHRRHKKDVAGLGPKEGHIKDWNISPTKTG